MNGNLSPLQLNGLRRAIQVQYGLSESQLDQSATGGQLFLSTSWECAICDL